MSETRTGLNERQTAALRFQDDAVWAHQEGSAWARLRVAALVESVDSATRSVLDVGCGDGEVARAIGRKLGPGALIAGIDRGWPGLQRVRRSEPSHGSPSPLAGDADALPLRDRTFDLVMCSEVLEHLPDAVLAGAARELMRVTRRNLLVSVPNREDLERDLMLCERCGGKFNAFGHLHSFDPAALDRLFPGFERVAARTAGPRRGYNRALISLSHSLGRYIHDPTAVCPMCGNRRFADRSRDPIRLLCDGLNLLVNPRKSHGYWLIASYRRSAETS